MKNTFFFKISILLISISSIVQWCDIPLGNTLFWWIIRSLFILQFIISAKWIVNEYPAPRPVNVFIIYVCLSACAGAIFQTENYWDWKLLVDNLMIFMLPLAIYIVNDKNLIAEATRFWIRRAWIILILLWPFLQSDAFGRFLVPFTFLALLLPLLTMQHCALTIVAYVITVIYGYESRSDVVKFSIALIMGFSLSIPILKYLFLKISKILMWGLLLIPFVFLYLGLTGTFNIFNIEEELGLQDEYMMTTSLEGREEVSALGDTRTFLYAEEIYSAIKYDYYLWGRTPARGYESAAFGEGIDENLGLNRGERSSCEVSILNIFNYFGIFGVFLYFIIFLMATYKAIYQSNNDFVKAFGVYVAFRWLFGFIEDFSRFDLNMMYLWFIVGLCYSERIRSLNNEEFKLFVMHILYPPHIAEEAENLYYDAKEHDEEQDEEAVSSIQ